MIFFSDGTKAAKRFPLDKLTLWIIIQSKSFMRKGFGEASKSVQAFVYLVLTS